MAEEENLPAFPPAMCASLSTGRGEKGLPAFTPTAMCASFSNGRGEKVLSPSHSHPCSTASIAVPLTRNAVPPILNAILFYYDAGPPPEMQSSLHCNAPHLK
eukprot:1160542-Pelagomonas_calceolata.AAC.6